MKKFICLILFCLTLPLFTACEISNTDLANSLEGNMTRLVYSVGYLDSITTEELSNLVNNSSYFTHSSLYTGNNATTVDGTSALNNSTLASNQSMGSLSPYRSRTYNSSIINNVAVDDTTTRNTVGVVDMSLLETSADYLNDILLEISTKRGIIMLYCTDLRSGRATLSASDKEAIAEYDDIIQETTNYLNNNTGMLTNHFNNITSISAVENSAELINAKLIRANEVLKTRYAKLDTCLDSLDAITNILINSIGYDYSLMYNTPQTNTKSTSNATLTESADNNLINSTTITETNDLNNAVETPSTTTNNLINDNCTNSTTFCPPTTNNVLDNNISNTNETINGITNSTTRTNNSCCQTNNQTQPNNANTDNTIINYNYDGFNTSNILPQQNQPATTLPTQKNISSTYSNGINNLTATTTEPTKTEIALNGGLVKHTNEEKIPASHIDSVVANTSVPNAGSLTKDHKTNPAEQLKVARPLEKYSHPFATLEETNETVPIPYDFRDEEYIESEKELTPEILPFAGTPESNTIEPRPLRSPELGLITLLPFQYEEENVLKKIPRQ